MRRFHTIPPGIWALPLTMALAASIACGKDAVGPETVSYLLSSVDGAPLPVARGTSFTYPPSPNGVTCEIALDASQLSFVGASVTQADTESRVCSDGSPRSTSTTTIHGTRTTKGDTVVINFPWEQGEQRLYAVQTPTGLTVVRIESWELGTLVATFASQLVFVRMRPIG